MKIDIFEGKASNEEMMFELERIGKLISEGYTSGQIWSDSGTESEDGYRGWWELRNPNIVCIVE